jgi:hypothetical protein
MCHLRNGRAVTIDDNPNPVFEHDWDIGWHDALAEWQRID